MRWNRKQIKRKAASVPSKECRQKPSAPKSSLSSLMRFSLSARLLLEAPGWHRVMPEGGDQDMKGIAGDLEQFAPARLGPFTDHFAHHHQPARGRPAVALVAGLGRFQTAREGRPLSDTRHRAAQVRIHPYRNHVGQREALQLGEEV